KRLAPLACVEAPGVHDQLYKRTPVESWAEIPTDSGWLPSQVQSVNLASLRGRCDQCALRLSELARVGHAGQRSAGGRCAREWWRSRAADSGNPIHCRAGGRRPKEAGKRAQIGETDRGCGGERVRGGGDVH